jgi:HipA-like protein
MSKAKKPRRGLVYSNNILAGTLEETSSGFRFTYDPTYVADPKAHAISLTLPKRSTPFESPHLFPFFFGLLAEGSAKDLQCRLLKLDENDHFGRLLATLHGDFIGSVTVSADET